MGTDLGWVNRLEVRIGLTPEPEVCNKSRLQWVGLKCEPGRTGQHLRVATERVCGSHMLAMHFNMAMQFLEGRTADCCWRWGLLCVLRDRRCRQWYNYLCSVPRPAGLVVVEAVGWSWTVLEAHVWTDLRCRCSMHACCLTSLPWALVGGLALAGFTCTKNGSTPEAAVGSNRLLQSICLRPTRPYAPVRLRRVPLRPWSRCVRHFGNSFDTDATPQSNHCTPPSSRGGYTLPLDPPPPGISDEV